MGFDTFFPALQKSGIWFNGQAAPKGAERIKLRSYGDLPAVQALAREHGVRTSIRDGLKNGPVVTFWDPKGAK